MIKCASTSRLLSQDELCEGIAGTVRRSSMVEQLPVKEMVAGSSPAAGATIFSLNFKKPTSYRRASFLLGKSSCFTCV